MARIHEFVDEGLGHSSYLIDLGNGAAAWATGTSGSNHYVLMQNDGNLVMYRPGSGAVWASGTCCR